MHKNIDDQRSTQANQPAKRAISSAIKMLVSVDALQRNVEQGVAAAFLPGRSLRRSAKLRLLSVTDPKPVRAAGLVWRRGSYRSPAAVAFADQLHVLLSAKSYKGDAQ